MTALQFDEHMLARDALGKLGRVDMGDGGHTRQHGGPVLLLVPFELEPVDFNLNMCRRNRARIAGLRRFVLGWILSLSKADRESPGEFDDKQTVQTHGHGRMLERKFDRFQAAQGCSVSINNDIVLKFSLSVT